MLAFPFRYSLTGIARMVTPIALFCRTSERAERFRPARRTSLGRGFRNAHADLAPERTFVVYAGSERYPAAEAIEAIGLPEMARILADPGVLRP